MATKRKVYFVDKDDALASARKGVKVFKRRYWLALSNSPINAKDAAGVWVTKYFHYV